jgi:hypothetical protein
LMANIRTCCQETLFRAYWMVHAATQHIKTKMAHLRTDFIFRPALLNASQNNCRSQSP